VGRILTVFRSRLRSDVPEEYWRLAGEMERRASEIEGFVEYKVFTAPDGERLSLAIFDSIEAEALWREHVDHREAQRRGRDRFYDEYDVSVCEERRNRTWRRDPTGEPLLHADDPS
jgi:heme-degrading monooxygenase HmoA